MSIFTIGGFVVAVLRNWRLVAVCVLFAALLALPVLWLWPATYAATSIFRPESSERQLPLAFAVQIGLARGGPGSESVVFYERLLRSHDLLAQAVSQPYAESGEADGAPLYRMWSGADEPPANAVRQAVRELNRRIRVRTDWDAGVVTVETVAENAHLAEQLNRRLLDLVNEFNVRRRMNRGAQERRFVEARLVEAQAALSAAESALERFHQQNRTYQGSPALVLEADRLSRRVQHQQQIYLSLAQALEEARIEEVRNTPIVSVVQNPEGTARRQGRAFRVMLLLALGLFVGIVLALLRELFPRGVGVELVAATGRAANMPDRARNGVPENVRSVAPAGSRLTP
jgi:uncharacterized protein involved in exopolysaccharide biosynthesis